MKAVPQKLKKLRIVEDENLGHFEGGLFEKTDIKVLETYP